MNRLTSWSVCRRILLPIFAGLTVISTSIAAETAAQRLDVFYAQEFDKFNRRFEPYIEQLDKCLKEMHTRLRRESKLG